MEKPGPIIVTKPNYLALMCRDEKRIAENAKALRRLCRGLSGAPKPRKKRR